jgi:hypothetical protein
MASSTPSTTTTTETSGSNPAAREFYSAALYMALVLLAALVALPVERLPDDQVLIATLIGTAVGLILAHWLAFRLASHLTEGGFSAASAAEEAGAQIAGGVAVALVASAPFVLLDGATALRIALLLLAAMPALTGLAIARMRGRRWLSSTITAAVVFAIAVVIVEIKAAVGH